ncbi:helix-turn-helix transcriptional regulator [Streptomyces sp. NPDC053705]|uniref:helix-turn-helix transcriptional regulator n=1 Tax=Streptomyces sp. NPDC053705 TaxID=3156668 RepID=UPI00343AC3E3
MTAPVRVGPSPSGGGPAVSLTNHERHVLYLIAHGHTQEDIARQLFTTPKGITPTVNRAMKKLGALNAPHAVLLACQAGLLDGKPRRHGDHAGFAAHLRRGEEPCESCWDGERAYRRDRKGARKAAARDAA